MRLMIYIAGHLLVIRNINTGIRLDFGNRVRSTPYTNVSVTAPEFIVFL